MSLFQELKRRNVIRVGIAYAVVSWLLLQLTEVLKELLGLPDEIGRTVVLLLAIGFIPTVIFAWAFEMTPEGIKRDADVSRDESIAPQTGHKLDRIIIGVLALALTWFAWDKFGPQDSDPAQNVAEAPAEAPLEKSIAVLPFVNMSGDADNEYFSDGLSEELLNVLAKVNGLKVAARTSSFKFKNAEVDILEIGTALNVATVLEGSVRRSGNQARITAQLIKVDDGFHLWSETYDRQLDNIFEVQDEIAQAIVDALKLPLLGQNNAPVESDRTSNFEAYDLYLLGRYHMSEFNEANMLAAIDYFERAIANDPAYAPAWAGLGSAYSLLQNYGSMSYHEALSLSEQAVATALELDPNLPDALNARGLLLSQKGTRSLAVPYYEQVLAIDPNNTEALRGLSISSDSLETGKKLELSRRASQLDPLSGTLQKFMLEHLANTGKLAEAEAMAEEILARDPDNAGVHEGLGEIYLERMDYANALRAFEQAWALRPGDVYPAWKMVQLYLHIGDLESAARWNDLARERGGEDSRWAGVTESFLAFYREEFEELYSSIEPALSLTGQEPPNSRLFYARVLLAMGRAEQAEQQLRDARAQFAQGEEDPLSHTEQVNASLYLASLLSDSKERARLIQQVSDYAERLEPIYPWDGYICTWLAATAALKAERDQSLNKLEECLDKDWVDAHAIRFHPAFADLQNDPSLQAILLKMEARAKIIREQYRAETLVRGS